jgi:hypothetical protein
LREARRLWEGADYLTTKPFNSKINLGIEYVIDILYLDDINVFPYDLPREL